MLTARIRIVVVVASDYMYNARSLLTGMKWYPQKSIIKLFAYHCISKKRNSLLPILNHSGKSYSSLGSVLSGMWLVVSVGI